MMMKPIQMLAVAPIPPIYIIFAISLLAPSQRYSMIEGEEACQL
jgi:hypothetical protein